MSEKMTITIASVPDREELVAELWDADTQWGELSQEQGRLTLEIYPNPEGIPWNFKFNDVVEILNQAQLRLMEPC